MTYGGCWSERCVIMCLVTVSFVLYYKLSGRDWAIGVLVPRGGWVPGAQSLLVQVLLTWKSRQFSDAAIHGRGLARS